MPAQYRMSGPGELGKERVYVRYYTLVPFIHSQQRLCVCTPEGDRTHGSGRHQRNISLLIARIQSFIIF